MTLKTGLLEAVEGHDAELFVAFLEKMQSKAQRADLGEAVTSLSRSELNDLWEKVHIICTSALLSLEGKDDNEEEFKELCSILQCTVTLATVSIASEEPAVPDPLLDTAVILHGVLPSLPDKDDKLKNSMVKLFETWWSQELQGKEELGQNSLVYLLERTLSTKSAKVDVKRLWTFREAVKQFDLTCPESEHVRGLVLHCLIHVTYLKSEEGRRFLSFLFSLGPETITLLHQTIKNQLPATPRSLQEAYGEVYFRAWRVASGESLDKIEVCCIQDLMHHAVHTSRQSSRSLAHILRKVLGYIHKQKKQRGVDEMLLRLYEPILWRSLKVANGNVRANAASLFVDTFPLQNPEANVEETDAILQKQFDILQNLLVDPCVEVRVVTVQGVCHIISVYWEVIPQEVIKSLITRLYQDLIYDVSSADVRVAVIRGQMELLDNHLCHPLLQSLLPNLTDFIHDYSEKVRLCMLHLLIKVKSVRGIRFWTIVPMEHLLSRLEMDTAPVCRSVMRLVFSSFLPVDKGSEVQLSRCIALIKSNPGAARCFYRYVHKHMSIEETVVYMVMLCRTVLKCVRADEKKRTGEEGSNSQGDSDQEQDQHDKENVDSDEELSVKDTAVMVGMLEGMAIIWRSIAGELDKPENIELKTNLRRKFAIAVPEFLKAFQNRHAYSALVLLSGFMPAQLVPHLSRSCLSQLKDMTDESDSRDYGILLEAMCNWGKMTALIELISDWLEDGLKIPEAPSSSVKVQKKGKKCVAFTDPSRTPQPKMAIKYLSSLMSHPLCQSLLLTNRHSQLTELFTLLKSVLKCLEKRFVSSESLGPIASDDFLTEAFVMYQKLAILLHNPDENNQNAVLTMVELYAWADLELLSALREKADDSTTGASRKRKVNSATKDLETFAVNLIKSVVLTGNNMLLVGVGDQEFASQFTDFVTLCLQTGHAAEFIPLTARSLYQLTEHWRVCENEADDGVGSHSSLVPSLFSTFLQCLARCINKDETPPPPQQLENIHTLLNDVKGPLSELLVGVYRCHQLDEQVIPEVMSTIMAAVLSDLTFQSKLGMIDQDELCGSLSDLPPLSSFLLNIIFKKNYTSRSFAREFEQCLGSGAVTGLHRINGAVYLTANLYHCKPSLGGLKECLTGLQIAVDQLQLEYENCEEDNPDRLVLDGLLSRLRQTHTTLMTV